MPEKKNQMLLKLNNFVSSVFTHYSFYGYVILFLLITITSIISPCFRSRLNIQHLLSQATYLMIISIGQTFVVLTAGIDLSVGTLLALVSCVAAHTMGDSLLGAILVSVLCLLIGSGVGIINALGVTELKAFPFIMTLGMMSICGGLAYLVSPFPSGYIPRFFRFISEGQLSFIPLPGLIFVSLLVIAFFILNKTRIGRYVYAVGGSEEISYLSGINIKKIKLFAYWISGLSASIAGLMMAARTGTGDPLIGGGYGLDSFTAVIIGNTRIWGGQGGLTGTIAGVFIIVVLNNILNMLDVSYYYQFILKGTILILALSFYRDR